MNGLHLTTRWRARWFRSLVTGLGAGFCLWLSPIPAHAQVSDPSGGLPSGKPDTPQEQNPTDLPDLPSGESFRPKDRPFTAEPEKPAPAADATADVSAKPAVPPFRFTQITHDGLSHTPCWVAGGRLVFIRSEADYDPAGADAAFWKKFDTGGEGPDAAAVHPISYARGQLVLRQPDGSERTITHFEGKHLRGLQCAPSGDYVAVLVGTPGDRPSELAIVNWLVASVSAADTPPPGPPLLIGTDDIEDYTWAETGERLYVLKDGQPWAIDSATYSAAGSTNGGIAKVRLPPFIRNLEFMALWGGPRTSDLVLAGLDHDRKGKPFGNSLYVVNVKAATAVKLPPPKKGLGTRFEQWLPATNPGDGKAVLYSSTDFTRFRLFRKDLKSGQQTELRPLPGDADGIWRWTGTGGASRPGTVRGLWARWNGAAYDQLSLLGESADPLAVIRDGNFRSVQLSPSGTEAVVDLGTGGSAINGLQIRRDLGLVELGN